MAIYRDIAADLRRRLGTDFAVGDRLPGIADLQVEYGDVALNTVRGALNLLAEEKLLDIKPGIGTFVAALPLDTPRDLLAGVRTAHEALGKAVDEATEEVRRAQHDALIDAAADLEATRPAIPTAQVPAWLRNRAVRRG